ncbi:Anaphase-promoting complex subunit 10 [Zea mays]|uniref:Anaphase-promoting complex subunit 10 n=1 Tax=Zea mays TaxID=4577 RepID=A0A1D6FJG7_MAIZE|nr:Anaphase-promoting complex subunit 10 [Zea mays]
MESDAEEEAAATPAAAATPGAGRLKGNPELTVDADMREMAKTAAWSVSSCKAGNGVAALRDDNLDTYWQSDGAQPHLVNIQFQKKVQLQLVVLYVDFKLDESYTPSKISIRAGDGFHNLKFWHHLNIYSNVSHDSRRLERWSLQSQLDGSTYHYPGLIHGILFPTSRFILLPGSSSHTLLLDDSG